MIRVFSISAARSMLRKDAKVFGELKIKPLLLNKIIRRSHQKNLSQNLLVMSYKKIQGKLEMLSY